MRRPTVQGAARRTHRNKFRRHGSPTGCFGGIAEHPFGAQYRTIACATHESGEYRRIRGGTYCPGALSGQASGEFQLRVGAHLANAG